MDFGLSTSIANERDNRFLLPKRGKHISKMKTTLKSLYLLDVVSDAVLNQNKTFYAEYDRGQKFAENSALFCDSPEYIIPLTR